MKRSNTSRGYDRRQIAASGLRQSPPNPEGQALGMGHPGWRFNRPLRPKSSRSFSAGRQRSGGSDHDPNLTETETGSAEQTGERQHNKSTAAKETAASTHQPSPRIVHTSRTRRRRGCRQKGPLRSRFPADENALRVNTENTVSVAGWRRLDVREFTPRPSSLTHLRTARP